MKTYIVAASLAAFAVIILGVATSYVLSGPEAPKRPQAAAAVPGAGAGTRAAPDLDAGVPHRGAAPGAPTSVSMPGSGSPNTRSQPAAPPPLAPPRMPGAPETGYSTGLPAPPGTLLGPGLPTGPRPPNQQSVSVPIIQPTDLGNAPTPTAGRQQP